MTHIAVLGAGLIGAGMVQNLVSRGHRVVVWNRTQHKLDALVAAGAVAARTPAEAAIGASRVHICLKSDPAVDDTLSQVPLDALAGVPVLDHCTNLPAAVAERYARLRSANVRYLHAPVFMSPKNARDATGLMLIAGPAAEVESLRPDLSTMTGKLWFTGERPELAAVHKLSGNAVIIAMAGLLGDVLAIGQQSGLTPSESLSVFDQFNPGAMLPAIGARVASGGLKPASFELDMARKDVALMLEAGGPGLQVLPAVAAAMDDALAAGRGAEDYAAYAWPRTPR